MIRRERIPLLHDHHGHSGLYAAMSDCPDLSGLDARAALEALRGLPRDRLTLVRGWRTNVLPLGPAELSTLPPALIANFSLHGYAVTDAGLPLLESAFPGLAAHRDDEAWREANVPLIFRAYGELSGLTEEKLVRHFGELAEQGIGSIEDMAAHSPGALEAMRASSVAGRLACWAPPGVFAELEPPARSAVRGVKLFLDGSLGARTAALGSGWLGAWRSGLCLGDGELDAALAGIAGWKTGVSIHAIGRAAIEQALGALEKARADGLGFPVARLEHVQFIDRDQAFRARDLGIVLSMQPNFTSDSVDYADRLEPGLLAANNPFRMLIDEAGFAPGKDLVFGSDGMPHGIAYAARWSLFPPFPGQRLSLEELVAGYGPARGASGESVLEIDAERLSVRRIPSP